MVITVIINVIFWVFPYAFRIIRNRFAFIIFISLSIIYTLLEYFLVYDNIEILNENKKTNFIFSLTPLFFLLIFKSIDLFFIKYKKRHIYFTERYFKEFSEGEAEKADWIDFTFKTMSKVFDKIIADTVGLGRGADDSNRTRGKNGV